MMDTIIALIRQEPDIAIACAAFLCGVAAIYIVSIRTMRRRKLY